MRAPASKSRAFHLAFPRWPETRDRVVSEKCKILVRVCNIGWLQMRPRLNTKKKENQMKKYLLIGAIAAVTFISLASAAEPPRSPAMAKAAQKVGEAVVKQVAKKATASQIANDQQERAHRQKVMQENMKKHGTPFFKP
jgi:hypothetical protein